jgi:hypothetical protein
MLTDFSPGNYIKERHANDVYRVSSWVRVGGMNTVTMERWNVIGTRESQSLHFPDDRMSYYSEYFQNTQKPIYWYGPKGHRPIVDGIFKPVYHWAKAILKRS